MSAVGAVTPVAGPHAAAASDPPLFGVTVDGIGGITRTVAAERSLPERRTTRVYVAVTEPASCYLSAVRRIHTVSRLTGELLDSGDATTTSTGAYEARVEEYPGTLGSWVDVGEIGNEVNGNWSGPYTTGAAKIAEAYAGVTAAGGRTALTLVAGEYGADKCGDGADELIPVQYLQQYVPAAVRDGLTYVFESYHATECGPTFPTDTRVAAATRAPHALYPDARLGFREVGLPGPVNRRTLATGEAVMRWA